MSDPNDPYAPPTSMLSEPPRDPAERWATRGQRFLDLLIDQVMLTFIRAIQELVQPVDGLGRMILEGALVSLVYYFVLEGLFGRTVGKLVTGTQVVALDGRRATLLQILGRSLARFIPFEPLSFFGRDPVGWHDSLSNTRVIQIR